MLGSVNDKHPEPPNKAPGFAKDQRHFQIQRRQLQWCKTLWKTEKKMTVGRQLSYLCPSAVAPLEPVEQL